MSRKVFVICSIIIVMAMGAVIGGAVSSGNILLPIIVPAAGILLMVMLRRSVKEVIEDERNYRISEKASRKAIQIFGISAAVLSSIFITLGRKGSADISQAGFTLSYAVGFLLMLYLGFYTYYNKKHRESDSYEE